jgi:hypothetical protein
MHGPWRVVDIFTIAWLFAMCVAFSPALVVETMAAERANPEWATVLEHLRVVQAPVGGPTKIHLRNRKVVRGTFRGLEPASDSLYAAEWAAWRAGAGASYRLPAPGEMVHLHRGRVAVTGPFEGFEPFAVRLAATDSFPSRVFSLSVLDSMVAGSASVSAESLTAMFRRSVVPQVSRLVIQTPQRGRQSIPVESIATLDNVHDHGFLFFSLLVLGAAAAAVITFIATYHGAFS